MNYEVAPFPLNNPLTPTTLEVACNGAGALHAFYFRKFLTNLLKTMRKFKFYSITFYYKFLLSLLKALFLNLAKR